MESAIDLSRVVPVDEMQGDDDEDTIRLRRMIEDATRYLSSFSWCSSIARAYFGLGVGGIVGVFLFRIVPARDGVDEWIWVIVGDLPPAYITTEDCPNPATALDGYIGAMTRWVKAVKAGQSVRNLIPVNVPATQENAERLESRLQFLDKEILVDYADDLKA